MPMKWHRPVEKSGNAATAGTAQGETTDGRRRWTFALAVLALTVLLFAATVAAAHAAGTPQIASSLDDVLNNLRNWVLGIVGSVAIAFFSWGGLKLLLASGDPEEIGKAKNAFKNGGYGLAVALLAPLLVAVLEGILG
jgi:type IV secretory pathway VirB2 component (pilin)